MSHGRDVAEVVEGHDLNVVSTGPNGAPEVATDPTEAVDTYPNRHDMSPRAQPPRHGALALIFGLCRVLSAGDTADKSTLALTT
jgi:hypothetical protein